MAKLPLEGLRVVEVGVAWAVPMATKILGDMGAEVIKVESTTRLDLARGLMYPDHQMPERFWDDNGVYITTNVNKLGLTLNLATARGQELFKELVKHSDIVAENFQQEVLSGFGLGYDELRKVNPNIIMLSSTGYGHSGPWVKYRSMGVGLEPMCGICFLTGYVDGPPMQSAIPYPDVPSALNAVTA
ncbi:MAG: CoA transferase, partial [Chloroflexota bacterium]